jgi:hypothetical protein
MQYKTGNGLTHTVQYIHVQCTYKQVHCPASILQCGFVAMTHVLRKYEAAGKDEIEKEAQGTAPCPERQVLGE